MLVTGFIDRTDSVLALLDGFMSEAEWRSDEETLKLDGSKNLAMSAVC